MRLGNERGGIPLALIILLAVGFLVIAGLAMCGDAIFEDEDEKNDLGWAPGVESSRPPDGRDGDARDYEDDDQEGCDGSCGNSHEDCENNTGECSDDDQVKIGPICVEDGACRFG